MFFRTAKQSLGLKDCQSTGLHRQKARIYNLFYVYTFLQHHKKTLKAPNVEYVVKLFQIAKSEDLSSSLEAFDQYFRQNG